MFPEGSGVLAGIERHGPRAQVSPLSCLVSIVNPPLPGRHAPEGHGHTGGLSSRPGHKRREEVTAADLGLLWPMSQVGGRATSN